jgi:hypothetical protein
MIAVIVVNVLLNVLVVIYETLKGLRRMCIRARFVMIQKGWIGLPN